MSDFDLGETLTATVVVDEETIIAEINTAARGPAGPAGGGSNSITSETTSDGTAALYLDSIRFESTNGGPTQLGQMAWESTDGSIDAMLESGVIVAMGEDLVIRVRNRTGSPIAKGTALAYDGTTGASGRIFVKPWVGANIPTAKLFLGFAASTIDHNGNGYSQWFGKLAEINTSGGAQDWQDEQIIYAVPGASATLTNVAPTSGEYAAAAVVVNAGNGTSGILFVRPTFEAASSTSATANTLVLRNSSGGATLYNLVCDELDVGNGKFQASTLGNVTFGTGATVNFNATTYTYGTGAASAHRIALGAGTTGAELFEAATAAAARTTLGFDGMIPEIPFTVALNSDFSTASTSFVNATGLSFPVAANKIYSIVISLFVNKNDAAGMQIQITGPSSPTMVFARLAYTTNSVTNATSVVQTAFSTATATFNTFNGDGYYYTPGPNLLISNGANAGTVQLQLRAVTSGTAKIYAGSTIVVTEL